MVNAYLDIANAMIRGSDRQIGRGGGGKGVLGWGVWVLSPCVPSDMCPQTDL